MPVTAEHVVRSPVVLPSQRGAGMTEYFIILGAISIAAVGTFAAFGDTVRSQTAVAALELAGMDSSQAIQRVRKNASRTVDVARSGGPFFDQVGDAGGGSGGSGGGGAFDPTFPFDPPGDGAPPFDPPGGGTPPLDPPGAPPGGGMCPAGRGGLSIAAACHEQEMLLSDSGETWLKEIEKLSLYPYDDQKGMAEPITEWVEGATIGYGHLIDEEEWDRFKDGITQEEAERQFQIDMVPFVDLVNEVITVDAAQHEFDAMVILAYNIGPGDHDTDGFSNSSVAKLVNDPDADTDFANLEAAWKAWNQSQGRINQGLINRRAAEWDMYSQGIYRYW